jgi:hypothetical protein
MRNSESRFAIETFKFSNFLLEIPDIGWSLSVASQFAAYFFISSRLQRIPSPGRSGSGRNFR